MKNPIFSSGLTFALVLVAAGSVWTACSEDSSPVKEGPPDSGTNPDTGTVTPVDGGNPDGGKDCFDNPKTHFEIINACTTATKLTKNPNLKKLLPDGGLPPLP